MRKFANLNESMNFLISPTYKSQMLEQASFVNCRVLSARHSYGTLGIERAQVYSLDLSIQQLRLNTEELMEHHVTDVDEGIASYSEISLYGNTTMSMMQQTTPTIHRNNVRVRSPLKRQ